MDGLAMDGSSVIKKKKKKVKFECIDVGICILLF